LLCILELYTFSGNLNQKMDFKIENGVIVLG
jgi:hypothetical protein